jgi:syntaxin 8
MSNPNALLLLADHIKLSLLEQKRAKTLNLRRDSQDGHISRSLDQFREGLEALEKEQLRLEEAGDETYAPSHISHQDHPLTPPQQSLQP